MSGFDHKSVPQKGVTQREVSLNCKRYSCPTEKKQENSRFEYNDDVLCKIYYQIFYIPGATKGHLSQRNEIGNGKNEKLIFVRV